MYSLNQTSSADAKPASPVTKARAVEKCIFGLLVINCGDEDTVKCGRESVEAWLLRMEVVMVMMVMLMVMLMC